MFIIGVDPHRGSHVTVVLDDHEQMPRPSSRLTPTSSNVSDCWTRPPTISPRLSAIEGAARTIALLAQQLVAAGEQVIEMCRRRLAARLRLLDNEQRSKTNHHDARSVAVAAERNLGLRHVTVEDQAADDAVVDETSPHDFVAGRTRCRVSTPTAPSATWPKATSPSACAPSKRPPSWRTCHPATRDRPPPQTCRSQTPRRGAPLRRRPRRARAAHPAEADPLVMLERYRRAWRGANDHGRPI